jgi:hypothetical protein
MSVIAVLSGVFVSGIGFPIYNSGVFSVKNLTLQIFFTGLMILVGGREKNI